MKRYTLILCLFLTVITLFSACKKEYDSAKTIDDAAVQDYIKKNNLTSMKPDPAGSGFYFQILDPGTGSVMLNKDSVLFEYQYKSLNTGQLYFGTAAYTNNGTYLGYIAEPSYPSAFRESLQGLKYGAKVRILIPSYLAFGKNGNSSINIGSNEIIDANVTTYATNKQWQVDDKRITDFLTSKNLTAVKDPSRVYVINGTAGTGNVIDAGSTFVVNYTGRLLSGTQFDSSTSGAFSTTLNGVISGWKVLRGYKAGSKLRIFVPSDLAYGTSSSSAIPANSVLDFDIEIVSVTN